MIAATFFTPNGRFPELAKRLAASCQRFNLRCRISPVQDAGDWLKSNNIKPQFILDTLLKYREPVLWLDADCEVMADPIVPDGAEFGILNWKADKELSRDMGHDPSVLVCSGGVIYFDYTAPSLELLIRWVGALAAKPEAVDDQVLADVFNSAKIPIRTWWMPPEMNWMVEIFGGPPADCVIRHDFCNRQHR